MDDIRKELTEEILNLTPSEVGGRWLLSPRLGKSKLVIDLIKRDKPKRVLWVTPFTRLAKVSIPEEFIKWRAKTYLKRVKTITWRSLEKEKGYYDLIILDEEQFITRNNSITLLRGELKWGNLISMTGTPSKDSEKLWLLGALGLEVLYDFNIEQAVDVGILADYSINVIKIPISFENTIHVKTKTVDFMTSEAKNYFYIDSKCERDIAKRSPKSKASIMYRANAIYNSTSKLSAARTLGKKLKGRKLYFCSNSAQAEKISNYTYHSKTNDIHFNQFLNGDIDEIALVNKGGVGDTYKNIDHLIVVQVDSDVNGNTSQKIARTLLKQGDYKAQIWVLLLEYTQDEKWVKSALADFNQDKISIKTLKEFEDGNK